jgi:hypothetical protein
VFVVVEAGEIALLMFLRRSVPHVGLVGWIPPTIEA